MEKSVTITYDIVNSEKRDSTVAKTVTDEIKRICDTVKSPIDAVVINCRQADKKIAEMPTFDELMKLQNDLHIGEITVNKSYSNTESRSPQEILDELRRLHDEFGDQICELEEDPETASSALQSIYAEMEIQLDAFEDALGGE